MVLSVGEGRLVPFACSESSAVSFVAGQPWLLHQCARRGVGSSGFVSVLRLEGLVLRFLRGEKLDKAWVIFQINEVRVAPE